MYNYLLILQEGKCCFLVIGAHTFIVYNLAPKMELSENTFYKVKLNKAMKLAEYDIVKSFDLSVKMTWGKKLQIPSNVDELRTKAKQVANKIFWRGKNGQP